MGILDINRSAREDENPFNQQEKANLGAKLIYSTLMINNFLLRMFENIFIARR